MGDSAACFARPYSLAVRVARLTRDEVYLPTEPVLNESCFANAQLRAHGLVWDQEGGRLDEAFPHSSFFRHQPPKDPISSPFQPQPQAL
jgi:hypothetical protein